MKRIIYISFIALLGLTLVIAKQFITPKAFPVPERKVKKSLDAFNQLAYPELKVINNNVRIEFLINADYLENLVNSAPDNSDYIKISIVQIPPNIDTVTYPHLIPYLNQLYFFYSITDNNGSNLNNTYYDLDTANRTLKIIPPNIYASCLKAYNDTNTHYNLKKTFYRINGRYKNDAVTESIFCKVWELKSYFAYAGRRHPSKLKYIKQVFSLVDTVGASEFTLNPFLLIYYARNKLNHHHFGLLWYSLDDKFTSINNFPVYDINELCPNHCPDNSQYLIEKYLRVIYIFTISFCFLLALYLSIKKGIKKQQYLIYYLAIVLIAEISALFILFKLNKIQTFVYNFAIPLFVITIALFYLNEFKSKTNKTIHLLVSSIFFLLLCTNVFLTNQSIFNISNGMLLVGYYLYCSLQWFMQQLRLPDETALTSKLSFWVSTGLLLWSVYFIFRTVAMNFLAKVDPIFFSYISIGHTVMNILLYLLIIQGLTCIASRQK